MSGPLKMTIEQIDHLSRFLHLITEATTETGCVLESYAACQIRLPEQGGSLEFFWDSELGQYRIDDRIGS